MSAIDTLASILVGDDEMLLRLRDQGDELNAFELATDLREHLTGPAWITLAERLDICPVHATDVEICLDDELPCRTDDELRRYVDAVASNWGRIPRSARVAHCPECGMAPDETDTVDIHELYEGYVIVGCEGYYVIDPNTVGIASPNWEGPTW